MSIGVLLVTHPGVGDILLKTTCEIIGACPMRAVCLSIPTQEQDHDPQQHIVNTIDALDEGQGVLILTDAFGATPSNMACAAAKTRQAVVVSGINLPMLIRVFNYPELNLQTLANKAAEGGVRGVQISALEGA